MIRVLLAGSMYVLQLCMYAVGSKSLFDLKMKRKWLPMIIGGLVVMVLVGLAKTDRGYVQWFQMAYYVPLIFCFIFTTGRKRKRISSVLSIFCISICMAEVYGIFLDHILIISDSIRKVHDIVETILNIGFFLVIGKVKVVIQNHSQKIAQALGKIVMIIIIFMGIAQGVTIGGLIYARRYLQTDEERTAFELVAIISFIAVAGIILFVVYARTANEKMQQLLVIERELKLMQEQYYTVLLEKEEETKRYRHDMNNHLLCLHEMANANETGEVQRYVRQMQEEFIQIHRKTYITGDDILDVLLNYYLAGRMDIKISVIGKCMNKLPVSEMDMCTIFSNLIKNAVEDVEGQESTERYIKIKIRQGKQFTAISIINSSEKVFVTEQIETTKKDKKNHGIGLKNVRTVVERNKGTFTIQGDGTEVVAEVIL